MDPRLTPFEMVFGATAASRFPEIQRGLVAAGLDPSDRDAFVLAREVVTLLQELRPDDGLGEGVRELVGFVHACYRHWADGGRVVAIGRDTLERALREPEWSRPTAQVGGPSYYLQLAPQRVWGTPVEGGSAEPLDGGFVLPRGDRLSMVTVFGMHPGRAGLTVVEVDGARPSHLRRDDGSSLFSPRLEGGAEAGLFQIVGGEELLELGFRVHALLGPAGAGPGRSQVAVG